MSAGGGYGGGGYGGGPLSIDFGIWDFVWRSIVLIIGLIFIIPTPWVMVWYIKWMVSNVHVPGRPNLSFTGDGDDRLRSVISDSSRSRSCLRSSPLSPAASCSAI